MMYQEGLFQDKIALVTGGRSGIGYQIAKDMLSLGAKVIICSRKEELGEVMSVPCDIRQEESIHNLADIIKEKHGRLDILVNNAGGQFPTLAEHTNNKGWNAVINNNLNGTFYMTRDMANHFFLPQQNGTVVNIIAQIHRGFPGMVHTGAARAGVENMTKTLALEWSHANIRINSIAPGTIESSGLATYPKPVQDMFEEGRKANPLKRFGAVEDISNAVCFMASPLSSYISGVTLYVDGAAHLNGDKMGLPNVLKSFM